MISAIKQRTKALNSNSYAEKGVNPNKVFLYLKKAVFKQFKEKYSKYYLYNAFKKEELLGISKSKVPCVYDKYLMEELVLNKKSHFNAQYKEVTLLTLPYLTCTKLYNKMEQQCVLKSIMLLPKEFPPNLFPSGKKLLNIINNRQILLQHKANTRFQSIRRISKAKAPRRPSKVYQEEGFKLADISFSVNDKTEDFFYFYFKKGIYTSQVDHSSKKEKKTTNIKEIEFLINVITKSEEIGESKQMVRDKHYAKVLSIRTRSNRRRTSSKKYSTGKAMMTPADAKTEQYNVTTVSTSVNPRTLTFEKRSNRKFKTVSQFISMNNVTEKKEREKEVLMKELVAQFNKSKEKKENSKRRIKVEAIPHFYSLTMGANEKSEHKESNLHFKTKKLLRNIEAFNHTQRDAIISSFNFERTKKFPMIYSKNIIQSQRNQIKRCFLDEKK